MKNIKLICALVATLLPSLAFGAVGDLDTTFGGGDGLVTTDIVGGFPDTGAEVAIDADGKIVVVGDVYNFGSVNDFVIVRYTADGVLDTTFGTGGKVVTDITGNSSLDYATSVAIDADGKIVVAGYAYNGTNYDFAVARYDTVGSLDPTFDSDGKQITVIGSGDDEIRSVAIDANGKIVVAGYTYNGTDNDFAVARYDTNGSLDTTFGSNGKQTTLVGSGADVAISVAIDVDGNIVVAGYSYNGINNDFAVARYDTVGSLDTTFDSDGKQTTTIGTGASGATSVAIDADEKIVVAGSAYNGTDNDFAVVRYKTDGSLDETFDGDGKLTTAIGSNSDDSIAAVVIDASGNIIVVGYIANGADYDFGVARYKTDGSLDTAFSGDGKLTNAIGSGSDIATSVAIDTDGNIVVAGYSSNGSDEDFAVARYLGAECGNGSAENVEGCDDGNTTSGDGCNAVCGDEVTSDGTELASINPTVDFSALEDGSTISLTAPDPRGSEGALVVKFLVKTKATDLPDTCSCTWSIDPTTLGTYSAATTCDTDLTLDASGAGTLTVAVDCGIDGSGSFQQAVTVAAAGSSAGTVSNSSGGCSLVR